MGRNDWQDMTIVMDMSALRLRVPLFRGDREGRQPFGRVADVGKAVGHNAANGAEKRDEQIGNANARVTSAPRAHLGRAKHTQGVFRDELAVEPDDRGRLARLREQGGELEQKRIGIGTEHPAPFPNLSIRNRQQTHEQVWSADAFPARVGRPANGSLQRLERRFFDDFRAQPAIGGEKIAVGGRVQLHECRGAGRKPIRSTRRYHRRRRVLDDVCGTSN